MTAANPSPMQLSSYRKGDDVLVIMLTGKLDAASAEDFGKAYEAEVPSDIHKVIIDCGKLQSISSVGLGMLMRSQQRLKSKGGQIKLANVPSVIAGVLRVVHLDKVFGLYPTIGDAVKDFE
jgi:anti-sigma B factor antagonist